LEAFVFTPQQRTTQKVAAHARWGREDPATGTALAAAFNQSFSDTFDPTLPESERLSVPQQGLRRADRLKTSASERLAYTVNEVLERVPVSRSHLYNEIAAGRLIATKIGARTLFTPQALENWLAAGAER
jgi:excisionase family DNA binding protein